MPFEVGQRVQIIHEAPSYLRGLIGTVTEIEVCEFDNDVDYRIDFDQEFEDDWGQTRQTYWVFESNLEPVELDPNRPPRVGDRVIGVGLMDGSYNIDGQVGTIMRVDTFPDHVGIAFDNWHDGHGLMGNCTNNGLWVDRNHWVYADAQTQTKKTKRKTSGRKTGFGKFAASKMPQQRLDQAVDTPPF